MRDIDVSLVRSEGLIRTFGKRIATDKMIQGFFMLNVIAVLGIIVYAVMKGQGPGSDDGGAADDATPSGDDAIALRARHMLRW